MHLPLPDSALQAAHSRALERCRLVEVDAADTLLPVGAPYRPTFGIADAQPDDSAARVADFLLRRG